MQAVSHSLSSVEESLVCRLVGLAQAVVPSLLMEYALAEARKRSEVSHLVFAFASPESQLYVSVVHDKLWMRDAYLSF